MNKKTWLAPSIFVGILVLVLLAISYWQGSQPKQATGEPIKIGAILALTGPAAYYGEQSKKGIDLAVDEIREEFPGTPIEVVYEDGLFTAKGGLDAYQKIKSSGGVDILITGSTPISLAVQPVAKSDGVLQMGVHVTADGYSSANDLSFRVSPSGKVEVPVVIQYMKDSQLKSIGVLYLNNDYGVSVWNSFQNALADQAGSVQIVAEEGFVLDTKDYRTSLLKIKQANPDAIFVIGTAPLVANILLQSKELGIETPFIAPRGVEDPVLLKAAGSAAEGLTYSYLFDVETSSFTKKFEDKYGERPDAYAAEGYEAVRLTVEALRTCDMDEACAGKYLTSLKNYPSIFGPLSFDENGDISYQMFMKTVKNGQFVRLEQ